MLFGLTILSLKLACCSCYVAYEMFQGFDVSSNTTTTDPYDTTSKIDRDSKISILTKAPYLERSSKIGTLTRASFAKPATLSSAPTTETVQSTVVPPIIPSKFKCPENEEPSNIGAYEVPTQRDIVILVRNTLMRMFKTYNEKALDFLKDIKEVTRATTAIELNCYGYGADRVAYHKCVRHVTYKCEVITKGLVSSLESQRRDVEAFTNGSICSVKGMKADPVDLIKTLAKEEVSLEFALPGFLRLMNACSSYCKTMQPLEQIKFKKPMRHMTDQDLVVKHFLTKKNYIQLLKGSK